MPDLRYFELNDDVGLHPETGTPQPLAEIALRIPKATMRDGEIVDTEERVLIQPAGELKPRDLVRALPHTRIVEVRDPLVAAALENLGLFHEIDAPPKRDEQHARGETQDARQADARNNDDDSEE